MTDPPKRLTHEQEHYARVMFKNRILESNGQRYEDLFVAVVTRRDSRFRPVKPQGPRGDQGNDGFIPEVGRYFQVYAPEDPKARVDTAGIAPGDRIFFRLLDQVAPKAGRQVQDAAIVLIAYFFEKCDLFEDPSG